LRPLLFLLFFYSATIAMSLMYALDLGASRVLRRERGLRELRGDWSYRLEPRSMPQEFVNQFRSGGVIDLERILGSQITISK